jgi:hypothetical protein
MHNIFLYVQISYEAYKTLYNLFMRSPIACKTPFFHKVDAISLKLNHINAFSAFML